MGLRHHIAEFVGTPAFASGKCSCGDFDEAIYSADPSMQPADRMRRQFFDHLYAHRRDDELPFVLDEAAPIDSWFEDGQVVISAMSEGREVQLRLAPDLAVELAACLDHAIRRHQEENA